MRTIDEIEEILCQAFNMRMFYDEQHTYEIEYEDIRQIIYHTGCYKDLNNLTVHDVIQFCDHINNLKLRKKNESKQPNR